MKTGKKLTAWIVAVLMIAGLAGCGKEEAEPTETVTTYETFEQTVASVKTTTKAEDGSEVPVELNLWYTDATDAPYLEAAAADFHDRYGVQVVCTCVDDMNYLETINQANVDGNGPDIFLASNDEIRKLRLAGLTTENPLYTDTFWSEHYPEAAKQASTSEGKQYGYPIYMDTCMMIYDTATTTQPESFESLADFAVNFVDETNTKVIFRWDIADPFFDYLFLGNGAEILGENGEDTDTFSINNDTVIQNMSYYQSLHEYFSIDVDNSSYDQVKAELTNGTLIYGIVKTDVLRDMGSYGSSYALCQVPALTGELSVQVPSITYGAFVNAFTKQPEYANLLGAYLSYEYAENQFGLSRKVAVRSDLNRTDGNETAAYAQYQNSTPTPKALENGDFWIYTEICFKNIWNGSDVTTELNGLQTRMEERLQN